MQVVERPFGVDTQRFLDVGRKVFRGDPSFVAPLELDMKDRFDPKKNPFFEHAEGAVFIAVKNGEDVGRCTAQIDKLHIEKYQDGTGFFGFLDTIDDPGVARALLDAAADWLKKRGMKKMRGPMSLSINEEMGCLVEGFDTPPAILMPHSRSYQGALIEAAGLEKEKDVFAWKYEVGEPPTRARKAHDEVLELPEVRIRSMDRAHMERETRMVMEIFNDAWKDNWGFVPMTDSELKKMAADLKLILVPDLALVAEVDGEAAAISIALPNINEMIRDLDGKLFPFGLPKLLWRLKVKGPTSARLVLLGIKKKFRIQKKYGGLSTALYVEMNDRGKKLGMKWGELSWTLEDNAPVNLGIKMMGGKVYKKYRVYQRPL
ncbi:MAG: hypothetical protein HYV09_01975 [Deltaproteobacteria bacterium]|nr:hypothetical protein [Deltaproteobacteria bacterium]